jgi:hypothetical protein
MENAELMQMLHGATQLKHELEALAGWKGTLRQITVVFAAYLLVKRLDVSIGRILQQDKPVTFRSSCGAEAFHHVRVGAVP